MKCDERGFMHFAGDLAKKMNKRSSFANRAKIQKDATWRTEEKTFFLGKFIELEW
jgi:hypothetical protein